MSELSRDAKGKTGMQAMKGNFRRPTIKRKSYALQADLYMKTAKEIAQYAGRTCKQPEDIMGAIENLMELVLVLPTTAIITAMGDPDDPMDQATLKIYLSKEIDLYLKHQDQYKENKTKMFNLIIGQCIDLMISKLESEILWKQVKSSSDVARLLTYIRNISF
eukprot:7599061-Ditylum_brightwellii.AAC.1